MKSNGKIITELKKKSIGVVENELETVLTKHGTDKNFEIYMSSKLYPKIIELQNKIKLALN